MGEPAALTPADKVLISGTARAIIFGVENDELTPLDTLASVSAHQVIPVDTILLQMAQEYERMRNIAAAAAFYVASNNWQNPGVPHTDTYWVGLMEQLK